MFLMICNSDVGIAVPTPIFPVDSAENPVPAVPTFRELDAVAIPTTIFGLPDKEVAVVAVPVKLPTKVVAVTIPETLMLEGSLLFDRVPDSMLLALICVIPIPEPTKLEAVTMPATLIFEGSLLFDKVPDRKSVV